MVPFLFYFVFFSSCRCVYGGDNGSANYSPKQGGALCDFQHHVRSVQRRLRSRTGQRTSHRGRDHLPVSFLQYSGPCTNDHGHARRRWNHPARRQIERRKGSGASGERRPWRRRRANSVVSSVPTNGSHRLSGAIVLHGSQVKREVRGPNGGKIRSVYRRTTQGALRMILSFC